MKKIICVLGLLILCCCSKEDDELQYLTVKPKYNIEGIYEGELHVKCEKYNNYDETYKNVWNITSFSQEKLAIETNGVTASAIFANNGKGYDYMPYSTYVKKCTTIVFVFSGNATVANDTLRESGNLIIYYGSNDVPMYGTFTGWGVKIN